MKCRLPMKIGTPGGGGVSYPDGAFIPVTKFTDGKTYALVAKINGTYRYINTTTYNNYTMNATVVDVTEKSGYVLFGSEPATFVATASGDGFTLGNGTSYLHGTTSSGTALRYGTTSAVWKVDTSETGGFDSGKYLPKEVSSSVWLKNTSGGYDWCIKFESAGSFGYDRAGRDNTYSTGFVSFILYEKNEGQFSGGGGSSGGASSYTLTIKGSPSDYARAVNWDTQEVFGAVGTYTVSANAEIWVVAAAALESNMANTKVIFNGTTVAQGASSTPEGDAPFAAYGFKMTSNTTVTFTSYGSGDNYYYVANVVTESSGGDSGGGSGGVDYHDNFADNDWATIAKVCAAGLAPTTWKVGDQKAMTINGTSYPIDIIGIQHDDYADGSGKAPFTFQLHDCYGTQYAMNTTATTSGGWSSTAMRNTHLPAVLALMPDEVKTAIKEVSKKSGSGSGSSTLQTTADKLFLLSLVEFLNSSSNTAAGEGARYEYYASRSANKTYNGSSATHLTRSPSTKTSSSSYYFAAINSGSANEYYGNKAGAIAPAFCLGASGSGGGGGSTEPTVKEYVVNITGTGNSTYCHVTVNGTKYTSAKTVTVTEGTQISCYVKTQSGTAGNVWVGVNLNGSWVLETTGTYKHTVNANCTVDLRHSTPTDHIYITTE